MIGALGVRWRWTFAPILAMAATTPSSRGADPSPRYPALPGTVEEAPAWLGQDAPFDVAGFFQAPPRGLNAATGYLAALAEFSYVMGPCFAPSPDRDRLTRTIEARQEALYQVLEALAVAPASVTPEMIDAAVSPYDEGFHKLVLAQTRERCVFQTGLGVMTTLPHAQASRMVSHVAELKVRRALEVGDLGEAIRTIEIMLRLDRDLKPRGHLITQLTALSIEIKVLRQMITPSCPRRA